MTRIKIATYNINSVRSRIDLVLNWLRTSAVDILCLQETKVEDSKFPHEEFTDAGYHVIFHGQKSYNGVAIISKSEPKKIRTGLGDRDEPDQARLISANISGINILNAYVPQGRERDTKFFDYKMEWLERFRRFLNDNFTPRQKVIWCGDLNIAPEDIDVHDPKGLRGHVCFNELTTAVFHDMLSWGFVDVFRKYHPEPGQYTFYDFRVKGSVERGIGWHVDHILATNPLAKKCTDSHIDLKPRLGEKPSDHAPLIAEFEI